MLEKPPEERAHAPVEVASEYLPPQTTVAKTVANPEVATRFATGGKLTDDDDLLDDAARGKSTGITNVGKGWRLETNSDGRLRWRWQVKDDAGNPITYIRQDGTTGYKRGSEYVGITQLEEARKDDKTRAKGKHKPRRGSKAGR